MKYFQISPRTPKNVRLLTFPLPSPILALPYPLLPYTSYSFPICFFLTKKKIVNRKNAMVLGLKVSISVLALGERWFLQD